MIAVVLAMVWARRGQAVALTLLSLLGVAAAVAGPAYLRAADRAVAAGQIGVADPDETSVALVQALPDRRRGDDPSGADPAALRSTPALTGLPGFRFVYSAQVNTIGLERDTDEPTRLVHRQDVCAHLTVVAGRCLLSESDVVLGERTAQRLGLHVGQAVSLAYAEYVDGPTNKTYERFGEPKTFLVTGFYRFTDPAEYYWGSHGYAQGREPAFVTEASLTGMDLGARVLAVDGYAGPGALDVDNLPSVRSGLSTLQTTVDGLRAGIELRTGMPELLNRIDAGQATVHLVVPILAVALVLLACLTIFLAVGYGTDGRRTELAVVALRGARAPQRWWLGTGESIVAIVAGGVLGCLAGQLIVNAVTAVRFPGVGADPGLSSLRWAPVAVAAAIATALVAEHRQLAAPVQDLLRRAPAVRGAARAVAFEVAVVLLAAAATVQLVVTGGTLTGVGTFATALVLIAIALPVARLLMGGVARLSRRALSAGRLGFALAGLHLSRRPGGVRLLGLLVAAVAVIGYAVSAVDVAAHGRAAQASLGVGAARVVTVTPTAPSQLLAAVRAADPEGRFAMAVVRTPGVLAADTTRLAAVANWPSSGPSRDSVARALRPVASAPVEFSGTLNLDLTASGFAPSLRPDVALLVSSRSGERRVPLGQVRSGRHTYTVTACADGCVLDSIHLQRSGGSGDIIGTLIFHGLPGGNWRSSEGGRVTGTEDGLTVSVNLLTSINTGIYLQPADAPSPLPAATAGGIARPVVTGFDGHDLPVDRSVAVPVIPAVGVTGTLVDLDYADRLDTGATFTGESQIWLSAAAPADVLDRIRATGLIVTSDVSAASVRAALDQDGPALGLLFYLVVGGLTALLAAAVLVQAATVDRARRAEDLSALRHQGLSPADLRRAVLWTYPSVAAAAVVAGTLVGVAGWAVTGWAFPQPFTLPFSHRPSAAALATAAVVVLAVLAGVAALAGRRTLRAIR
nr:FtsX-like permease family protein [uncultured Actinoplanes sp.]